MASLQKLYGTVLESEVGGRGLRGRDQQTNIPEGQFIDFQVKKT